MIETIRVGSLEYLTADNIAAPHCFTTRYGGVSSGYLASMNIGIHRGDAPENVLENFRILARELERVVMLRVVDEYWMDNIDAMDDLKQGIGLRAYGQHDPVIAYKEEGYEMFQAMINAIREETIRRLFLAELRPRE